jgi:hypothetical protein
MNTHSHHTRTSAGFALLGFLAIAAATASAQAPARKLPPNFFVVEPLPPNASRPNPSNAPAANLRIARGKFFSYALPEGWRVGEDGQFALTMIAADNHAITVMVGNSGLPPAYPPGQFVYEKLAALRVQNLQIGPPRPAKPVAGFNQAYEFDVSYVGSGIPSRGIAKCNVTVAYDSAVMAMTAALSDAKQWNGYSSWLPLVADQISAIDGGAFGRRGIMAQNLQNSQAYAEAARQYRDWSQKNWQQVTDARNRSEDKKNFEFRETMGNVQTYVNPYDTRVPLELPTAYQYFWVDRDGTVVGTNDPRSNPNSGSTGDWKPLERVRK